MRVGRVRRFASVWAPRRGRSPCSPVRPRARACAGQGLSHCSSALVRPPTARHGILPARPATAHGWRCAPVRVEAWQTRESAGGRRRGGVVALALARACLAQGTGGAASTPSRGPKATWPRPCSTRACATCPWWCSASRRCRQVRRTCLRAVESSSCRRTPPAAGQLAGYAVRMSACRPARACRLCALIMQGSCLRRASWWRPTGTWWWCCRWSRPRWARRRPRRRRRLPRWVVGLGGGPLGRSQRPARDQCRQINAGRC